MKMGLMARHQKHLWPTILGFNIRQSAVHAASVIAVQVQRNIGEPQCMEFLCKVVHLPDYGNFLFKIYVAFYYY